MNQDRCRLSSTTLIAIVCFSLSFCSVVLAGPVRNGGPPITPEELTSRLATSSAREVLDYLTKSENEQMPLWDYFVEHLLGELPPHNYAITGRRGAGGFA